VDWEAVGRRFNRTTAAVKTKYYVITHKKPANEKRPRPWTDDDVKRLRQLDEDGVDAELMARKLRRTPVACKAKLRTLRDKDEEEAKSSSSEEEQEAAEEQPAAAEERAEYEAVSEFMEGEEEPPQVISWSQAERLDAQVREQTLPEPPPPPPVKPEPDSEAQAGRTRWSDADAMLLREYRDVMRLPWNVIAEQMKRTSSSCQCKYEALLDEEDKDTSIHSWTLEERARLMELREGRGYTFREIAQDLGLTMNKCSTMYYSLVRNRNKQVPATSPQIQEKEKEE
jgi:hypothetical protein